MGRHEGTFTDPVPVDTKKIEPKVKWGAIAAYFVGVILFFFFDLLTADNNALLIAVLPDWVEAFILPILPAVGALVAGYSASHQWREPEVPNAPPTSNTTIS